MERTREMDGYTASPWEKGTWNSGEKKDARSVKRVRAGRQRYAYRHTQRHAPNLKFKFGTSHGTASYTGYSHRRARDVLARVRAMEEKGSKKEGKGTRRKETSDDGYTAVFTTARRSVRSLPLLRKHPRE